MRTRRLTRGTGRRLGAAVVLVFAFAFAAAILASAGPLPATAAVTRDVTAQGDNCPGPGGNAWSGGNPVVTAGDSVAFHNCRQLDEVTPGNHGLDFTSFPAGCDNAGTWWMAPDQPQSTECAFPTAGSFSYVCTRHPEMTGRIEVVAPAPPPTPSPTPAATQSHPRPSPTPSRTPTPKPTPSPSASTSAEPSPSPSESAVADVGGPLLIPTSQDSPPPALAANRGAAAGSAPLIAIGLVVLGILAIGGGGLYYYRVHRPSAEDIPG